MIELEAGDALVTVSAVHGGRVAQIEVGGAPLLIGADHPAVEDDPKLWGSYPMVPWAGRLRDGRFHFDDRTIELPRNMGPHAIHGTAFDTPWTVVDRGIDHVEMTIPLDWPFGGTAHQHLQLLPDALVCVLSVQATGQAMPAVVGWHPWFVKPLHDRLDFDGQWVRDADYIPSGQVVPPVPRPWDDCFEGAHHPLQLALPGGLTVTIGSDCTYWVVYDQPVHATCVEPQSAPPDAFNLGKATRLEPGEFHQRTMTISWGRTV
jgi:aldose 1-epimerase